MTMVGLMVRWGRQLFAAAIDRWRAHSFVDAGILTADEIPPRPPPPLAFLFRGQVGACAAGGGQARRLVPALNFLEVLELVPLSVAEAGEQIVVSEL